MWFTQILVNGKSPKGVINDIPSDRRQTGLFIRRAAYRDERGVIGTQIVSLLNFPQDGN